MTIGRYLAVDWAQQIEIPDDRRRAQVKMPGDEFDDPRISNQSGAEGVHHDGYRVGYADGISELDFARFSETGGDDVLAT